MAKPQEAKEKKPDGPRRCDRVTVRPGSEGRVEIQLVAEGRKESQWLELSDLQARYLGINLDLLLNSAEAQIAERV